MSRRYLPTQCGDAELVLRGPTACQAELSALPYIESTGGYAYWVLKRSHRSYSLLFFLRDEGRACASSYLGPRDGLTELSIAATSAWIDHRLLYSASVAYCRYVFIEKLADFGKGAELHFAGLKRVS